MVRPSNGLIGVMTRTQLAYRFAGDLHVERVRTELDVVAPSDGLVRGYVDPVEEPRLVPRFEDAPSGNVGQIDLAGRVPSE